MQIHTGITEHWQQSRGEKKGGEQKKQKQNPFIAQGVHFYIQLLRKNPLNLLKLPLLSMEK